MTFFDQADIDALLAEPLGQALTIDGQATRGLVELRPTVADEYGQLLVSDPQVTISEADLVALGVTAGAAGSSVVTGGVSYRVLAAVPDGLGLAELRLEVVS